MNSAPAPIPSVLHPSRGLIPRSVLLALACLTGGFLGGLAWERGAMPAWHPRQAGPAQSAADPVPSGVPSATAGDEPRALAAGLTAQIRSMTQTIARLEDDAKEDRLHYALLLQRGYSPTNTLCCELVQRQRRIRDTLRELQLSLRDAESLRERLYSVFSEQHSLETKPRLEETLRRDVTRWIRRNASDPDKVRIPDAAWEPETELEPMVGARHE